VASERREQRADFSGVNRPAPLALSFSRWRLALRPAGTGASRALVVFTTPFGVKKIASQFDEKCHRHSRRPDYSKGIGIAGPFSIRRGRCNFWALQLFGARAVDWQRRTQAVFFSRLTADPCDGVARKLTNQEMLMKSGI